MSTALADFLSLSLVLAGVGLLMVVLGVQKHVLVWKRRRCPTCGRTHEGGCRRYGS
jgi:hypothetical protein